MSYKSIIHKFLKRIAKGRIFLNFFYEASVTLMPDLIKASQEKKITSQSLMTLNAKKTQNRMSTNLIQ